MDIIPEVLGGGGALGMVALAIKNLYRRFTLLDEQKQDVAMCDVMHAQILKDLDKGAARFSSVEIEMKSLSTTLTETNTLLKEWQRHNGNSKKSSGA